MKFSVHFKKQIRNKIKFFAVATKSNKTYGSVQRLKTSFLKSTVRQENNATICLIYWRPLPI